MKYTRLRSGTNPLELRSVFASREPWEIPYPPPDPAAPSPPPPSHSETSVFTIRGKGFPSSSALLFAALHISSPHYTPIVLSPKLSINDASLLTSPSLIPSLTTSPLYSRSLSDPRAHGCHRSIHSTDSPLDVIASTHPSPFTRLLCSRHSPVPLPPFCSPLEKPRNPLKCAISFKKKTSRDGCLPPSSSIQSCRRRLSSFSSAL